MKLPHYVKKIGLKDGALNILKKEIPNAFNEGYGIEVCSTPLVLTIK